MLHGKEFVWGANSLTPTLGTELLSMTQLWSIRVNHYASDATLKLGELQAYYYYCLWMHTNMFKPEILCAENIEEGNNVLLTDFI